MKITEGGKKAITITLVVCAILFVLLFALVNFGAVAGVFKSVLSVLSPIIIGFAIAYILNPILRLFEFKVFKRIKKKSVLRGLSILSTYLVALLLVVAFFWLIIPSIITSVTDLVSKYDTYIAKTSEIINNVINKFTDSSNMAEYVDADDIEAMIARFFSVSGGLFEAVIDYISEYGMGFIVGIKNTVIGIFISIYVLVSKEKLQAQTRKLMSAMLPDRRKRRLEKYIMLTYRTFSGYFVGQITDSFLVMLITLVMLLIFRVPYALLVAVIVGVTNIIPIFGPIIGALPSFFIIFIVNPTKAFVFLVLIVIIQQIDGNVVAPKILGDSTGISSLGVICAIVVMGEYFGVLGMIIGVPIFAVAVTIIKELIETQLKKKGKKTDTAEYYLADAVADPHEKHVPVATKIFNNIVNLLRSAVRMLKKIFKKITSKNTVEASEAEETYSEADEEPQTEQTPSEPDCEEIITENSKEQD